MVQYIHTTTRYAINVHTLSKRVPNEEKIMGKNGHGHNMDIK